MNFNFSTNSDKKHLPEYGDDVGQVQSHGGHGEDGVDCDVTGKGEQPGQDTKGDGEPDRAQRCLGPGTDVPKEAMRTVVNKGALQVELVASISNNCYRYRTTSG